ncbi:MAG: twin-arginine translocation signal domain-containing protein [Candidatus Moduliflexus flocculans]|nr:twin-arginine translocation signal domain-containing protein [Candidatus Moduliflexus flocculans]
MPKGKLSRRTFLQLATAAAAGAALPESMLGVVRPAGSGRGCATRRAVHRQAGRTGDHP